MGALNISPTSSPPKNTMSPARLLPLDLSHFFVTQKLKG